MHSMQKWCRIKMVKRGNEREHSILNVWFIFSPKGYFLKEEEPQWRPAALWLRSTRWNSTSFIRYLDSLWPTCAVLNLSQLAAQRYLCFTIRTGLVGSEARTRSQTHRCHDDGFQMHQLILSSICSNCCAMYKVPEHWISAVVIFLLSNAPIVRCVPIVGLTLQAHSAAIVSRQGPFTHLLPTQAYMQIHSVTVGVLQVWKFPLPRSTSVVRWNTRIWDDTRPALNTHSPTFTHPTETNPRTIADHLFWGRAHLQ